MRLTYTEQHPDVIASKRLLEQLLEEQKRQESALMRRSATVPRPVVRRSQNLQLAVAEAEATVASLRARVNEYEARFATMKAAVSRIPLVEAEYVQLNRDYEVNKQHFEKLLNRRESAHISQELDASGGSADFRVVDPPRVAPVPTWPNRPLLMSLVLLGSLAIGFALAQVLSQIRPTFTDRKTLQEVTGLPILGSVSTMSTDQERSRQRKRLFAWGSSYAGLFATYGAVMVFLVLAARTI
jgi:polysaccharide chain length determinant protein (PEP-CTERM system associated)